MPTPCVAAATRRELIGEQPALVGKRLLEVDADATSRRTLTLQAVEWGMTVCDTEDPRQALYMLQNKPCELAIIGTCPTSMVQRRPQASAQPATGCRWCCSGLLGHRQASDGMFAATLTRPLRQSPMFDKLATLLASDPKRLITPAAARPKIDATLAQRHPLRIANPAFRLEWTTT